MIREEASALHGNECYVKLEDERLNGVRIPCLLHGGHRWATSKDAAGSLTACARCGALRHQRLESAAHGHFKAHTNLAAEFAPLPTHGAEELDES
jgi:hypothetical protein